MKTGDKVIVPAEINGYGRDLRAIVTEIEKFAGAIFVTVIFTEPCPEACGRGGGVYHEITCPFRNLCSFLASSGVPDLPPAASFWE